jgi:hypothetical protein
MRGSLVRLDDRDGAFLAATRDGHPLTSAHFLSDFYPAGTWVSGQTAAMKSLDDGREAELITGPNWSVGADSKDATRYTPGGAV